MKNLKLNECLFHGIRRTHNKDCYSILEDILDSKYILTHNDLRKKGICHERENLGYQGGNAVCVCFHPNNIVLQEKFKHYLKTLDEYGAFNLFVLENELSIILSPTILNDLGYRTEGGFYRMPEEIQITKSIPLTYMQAIGINESDNINEKASKINNLLTKYQYDVPIINVRDNQQYTFKKIL